MKIQPNLQYFSIETRIWWNFVWAFYHVEPFSKMIIFFVFCFTTNPSYPEKNIEKPFCLSDGKFNCHFILDNLLVLPRLLEIFPPMISSFFSIMIILWWNLLNPNSLLIMLISFHFLKGSVTGAHDGYDQWKTLQGKVKNPRREILLNIHKSSRKQKEAIILGKWKLISECKRMLFYTFISYNYHWP